MNQREKTLDNNVLKFLKGKGYWCIKYWSGSKWTKIGIPDILACVDGYFFAIEDKAKNGKPSLLQLKNLEWIRGANGFGILLYPDQFDNFKMFIDEGLGNLSVQQKKWYSENIDLQKRWKTKLEKM